MTPQRSERTVVFLLGAVQFVNILDFMIVMPLGPDFAQALGIPVSHLGYIGGSYTAAAAVAGLAASFFLDRFDRRSALAACMLGLVLSTALGAFAVDLWTLLATRVLAGAFGGPATALALSILSDLIPPERRGKAMGAFMGAFAAASVLGVPAGLELSRRGGWRLPFLAVAAMGLVVAALAIFLLPKMRGHLEAGRHRRRAPYGELFRRPAVLMAFAATALVMGSSFAVIPNISPYLQNNLGFPREHLGLLYLVGGAVSFVAARVSGGLVDRYGAARIATIGSLGVALVLYGTFFEVPPLWPVPVAFVGLMLSMAIRNVPHNTLMTMVPGPSERAQFMSLQSAVQHMASAAGAFLSSQMLTERADHSLVGMRSVVTVSLGLTLLLPFLLFALQARVKSKLSPVAA